MKVRRPQYFLNFLFTNFAFNSVLSEKETGVRFFLFTKDNKEIPVELIANKNETFNNIFFVPFQPVKFLCHGYNGNPDNRFPKDMKDIYLQSNDYNVILVDWGVLSTPYMEAMENVKVVGKEIARMIEALIRSGKSRLKDMHFIGWSLGGQVGAFISENLKLGGRKIPRVTGLDPASLGFDSMLPKSNRLDPLDADFVDVIKTSESGVGGADVGTVTFFPNGGSNQPGCFLDFLTFRLCSHSRSFKYYEESLTSASKFMGYKCKTYQEYKEGCAKSNDTMVEMGDSVDRGSVGSVYFDTNWYPPYIMKE